MSFAFPPRLFFSTNSPRRSALALCALLLLSGGATLCAFAAEAAPPTSGAGEEQAYDPAAADALRAQGEELASQAQSEANGDKVFELHWKARLFFERATRKNPNSAEAWQALQQVLQKTAGGMQNMDVRGRLLDAAYQASTNAEAAWTGRMESKLQRARDPLHQACPQEAHDIAAYAPGSKLQEAMAQCLSTQAAHERCPEKRRVLTRSALGFYEQAALLNGKDGDGQAALSKAFSQLGEALFYAVNEEDPATEQGRKRIQDILARYAFFEKQPKGKNSLWREWSLAAHSLAVARQAAPAPKASGPAAEAWLRVAASITDLTRKLPEQANAQDNPDAALQRLYPLWEKADRAFAAAARLAPDDAALWKARADAQMRIFAVYTSIFSDQPGMLPYYSLYDACTSYSQIVRLEPRNVAALQQWADALSLLAKGTDNFFDRFSLLREAALRYAKAAALAPKNAVLQAGQAEALFRSACLVGNPDAKGMLREAQRHMESALALSPKPAPLLRHWAEMLRAEGENVMAEGLSRDIFLLSAAHYALYVQQYAHRDRQALMAWGDALASLPACCDNPEEKAHFLRKALEVYGKAGKLPYGPKDVDAETGYDAREIIANRMSDFRQALAALQTTPAKRTALPQEAESAVRTPRPSAPVPAVTPASSDVAGQNVPPSAASRQETLRREVAREAAANVPFGERGFDMWVARLADLLRESDDPATELSAAMDSIHGSVNLTYAHYTWSRWRGGIDNLASRLKQFAPELIPLLRAKACAVSKSYVEEKPASYNAWAHWASDLSSLALTSNDAEVRRALLDEAAPAFERAIELLGKGSIAFHHEIWQGWSKIFADGKPAAFADPAERDAARERALQRFLARRDAAASPSLGWQNHGNALLVLAQSMTDAASLEKGDAFRAQALAVYPELVQLRPHDAEQFLAWGKVMQGAAQAAKTPALQISFFEQAVQCLQRVTELQPDDFQSTQALGWLCYNLGQCYTTQEQKNRAYLLADAAFARTRNLQDRQPPASLPELVFRDERQSRKNLLYLAWRDSLLALADGAEDAAARRAHLVSAVAVMEQGLLPLRSPLLAAECAAARARLAEATPDAAQRRALLEKAHEEFTWAYRRLLPYAYGLDQSPPWLPVWGDVLAELALEAKRPDAPELLDQACRLYELTLWSKPEPGAAEHAWAGWSRILGKDAKKNLPEAEHARLRQNARARVESFARFHAGSTGEEQARNVQKEAENRLARESGSPEADR